MGGVVVSVAATSAVFAQAPPLPLPGPVQPGRIERNLEAPPEPAPVLPPLPEPEPEPSLVPAAPEGGIQFVLKDVIVEGATVYSPDQLKDAYKPFLDQTISVDTLPQIEQAITVLYRRDGYILSRAMIDAQTVDPQAGVLHVKVYEGYIDKVRLDPLDYEVGPAGKLIRPILKHIEHSCRPGDTPHGDKPCPLHRDVLERYLLLVNDLPGVQASAVIQPSTDAEAGADLFVTITEQPMEIASGIDNRGSTYVGPLSVHQTASFNNLLGFNEATEFRATQSIPFNELNLINAVEEIPLTSSGFRLALDYTHSRSRPGDLLRSANLETLGDSGGVTLSYPLLRTRSENLLLHASLELRNSVTTATTDFTAFLDRTRVLTIGETYDYADRFLGVNLADFSLGQGLPFLGATRENAVNVSHAGSSPSFTKLDGEVSRVQQVFPEWNLLTAATGQYSFSKLLSSEQFGYGGERYGRAYDPSEILGDRGVAAKLEVQYAPDWTQGIFPWIEGVRSLQFFAFGDIGRAWVAPGPSTNSTGGSLGGGVRFTITDHLAGYVELAKPMIRPIEPLAVKNQDSGGRGPRIFFSVASKF